MMEDLTNDLVVMGNFEWEDYKQSKVVFRESNSGKFRLTIWKPNLLQKLLIWFGIFKYPIWNGK